MNSLRKSLTLSLTGILVIVFLSFWATVNFAISKVGQEQLLMHLEHDGDALLSGLSFAADGRLQLLDASVEAVYQLPNSGHYYTITSPEDELTSPSLLNAGSLARRLPPGQRMSSRTMGPNHQKLLVLARSLVVQGKPIQIAVAEDLSALEHSVQEQSSQILLIIIPCLIIAVLVQRFIISRELAPLSRAKDELNRLGRGEIEQLDLTLPMEVQPLIEEVNRLLLLVNRRLAQSRTAIGNLAHALKTPLAVLFRLAEDPVLPQELRAQLQEQTRAIHRRLEQDLKRARLAGYRQGGAGVQLQIELADLANVLRAIYRDKNLQIDIIAPQAPLPYDREDLLELIGNLSDNACKWASGKVRIEVTETASTLRIVIADDGPGCPADDRERMLKRGVRLDETIPGHGLGLAICREITDFYGGTLDFETDTVLGGLAVVATLAKM